MRLWSEWSSHVMGSVLPGPTNVKDTDPGHTATVTWGRLRAEVDLPMQQIWTRESGLELWAAGADEDVTPPMARTSRCAPAQQCGQPRVKCTTLEWKSQACEAVPKFVMKVP
eukprot:6478078-Amphidinium_carterae.1